MQAYLVPGAKALVVEIIPEALDWGGSWSGRADDGVPVAYASKVIKRVYRHLKDTADGVLVDVGANTGSFALLPAVLPSLRVLAFEPNPQVCGCLRANLRANGILAKADVFQVGLSATTGDAVLSIPPREESGLATLGAAKRFVVDHVQAVQTTTLDEVLSQHPVDRIDILKIDTEGAEKLVLLGARASIARYRPVLVVECAKLNTRQFGYERADTLALIEEYGYRYEWISGEDVWCVPV